MKILTIAAVITFSTLSVNTLADGGYYDVRDWRETGMQSQEIQTPAAKPVTHMAKSLDVERMIEDNPTAAGNSHLTDFSTTVEDGYNPFH